MSASHISGPLIVQSYANQVRGAITLKTIGDSRFAGGRITATGANSTATVAIGDLIYINNGPHNWAEYFACGDITVSDFAQAGSRSGPVSGRTDDARSYQMPFALASGNPYTEIVAILTSANDRGAAAPNLTAAETNANITYMVDKIIASGRRVLLCLEPPQKGTYWTAGMKVMRDSLHATQYLLQRKYPDMVRIADFVTGISNGAGEAYSDTSAYNPYYDDVHPKYAGAVQWGNAIIAGLGDWLPPDYVARGMGDASQTSLATNAAMTGTGGTGINSGTAPTSWTAARTAANSWDKSYSYGATQVVRANSTAYALGDRFVLPEYPTIQFLCTTAGTSNASAPTYTTTLYGTTTDGTATWTTIPAFRTFDGRAGCLIYGAGTADNTRFTLAQDVSMASISKAVGDTVQFSMFHASLAVNVGVQIEVQAMATTTKISSAFGMTYNYVNSAGLYPDGQIGKLVTPVFTIPATADTLRIRVHGFSKAGLTQAHLFTKPILV